MLRRPLLLTAALAALATGCEPDLDLGWTTRGQEDRASFAYSGWRECFLGCPVDRPMMLGTTEQLVAAPDDAITGLTVEASPADVLEVAFEERLRCCQESSEGETSCAPSEPGAACAGTVSAAYDIEVHALAAGSAELALHQPGGERFDWISLDVRAPAALAVTCEPNQAAAPPAIELRAGEQCTYRIDAYDSGAQQLKASRGFSVRPDDLEVVVLQEDSFLELWPVDLAELDEAYGQVVALRPGTATLRVEAVGQALELPITVR